MVRNSIIVLCILLVQACQQSKIKKTENQKVSHSILIVDQKLMNGILISSSLKNNTDDTIYYLTMSCSYADGYKTDDSSIVPLRDTCFLNAPFVGKIPPRQITSQLILLTGKNQSKIKGIHKFRMGFDFIALSKENERWAKSSEYGKMKHPVWSNEVTLSDAF